MITLWLSAGRAEPGANSGTVRVPANTTAQVWLPARADQVAFSAGHVVDPGIVRREGGLLVLDIGSGFHHLEVR